MSYHYRKNESATGEEVKDIVKFFYKMTNEKISEETSNIIKLEESNEAYIKSINKKSTVTLIISILYLLITLLTNLDKILAF